MVAHLSSDSYSNYSSSSSRFFSTSSLSYNYRYSSLSSYSSSFYYSSSSLSSNSYSNFSSSSSCYSSSSSFLSSSLFSCRLRPHPHPRPTTRLQATPTTLILIYFVQKWRELAPFYFRATALVFSYSGDRRATFISGAKKWRNCPCRTSTGTFYSFFSKHLGSVRIRIHPSMRIRNAAVIAGISD